MDALAPIVRFFGTVIAVLRPTVFTVAVATALAAAASWSVRTRRVGPFTSFARITRRSIDPLFLPAERRVVRLGGAPAQAPWWTVGAVVIGGLILLAILEFLHEQLMLLVATTSYGGMRGIILLLVTWSFMVLKVAIMARVISTWVGGGPHSRWWGWSYRMEWLLAPIRRVLPTFGPIDLSPLVAYFGLGLLQSLIGSTL